MDPSGSNRPAEQPAAMSRSPRWSRRPLRQSFWRRLQTSATVSVQLPRAASRNATLLAPNGRSLRTARRSGEAWHAVQPQNSSDFTPQLTPMAPQSHVTQGFSASLTPCSAAAGAPPPADPESLMKTRARCRLQQAVRLPFSNGLLLIRPPADRAPLLPGCLLSWSTRLHRLPERAASSAHCLLPHRPEVTVRTLRRDFWLIGSHHHTGP
jgi:hypothetical protein